MRCPRCSLPLEAASGIQRCGRCEGAWVPESLVHERVTAARGRRTRLTWSAEQREPLPCAVCAAPMETIRVKQIALDRCARHGIWFDVDELPRMLELAAASARSRGAVGAGAAVVAAAAVAEEARAAGESSPVVEVAAEVADVALEVASDGIFDGVLDGLADLLGGLFDW